MSIEEFTVVEYLAQINMTGYLPMSDDIDVFPTAVEAWEYLTDEREHGEENADGDSDGYTEAVRRLRAMTGPGEVHADTPGYEGDHDLGLVYTVSEVGHEVSGEIDGEITHASAKAIASAYARPDRGPVEAFVFAGKIPYGDNGDLWYDLVAPSEYASADRAEKRLLDLLHSYITQRADDNETGPVKGWPGMDVERRTAPWDVNPDECLTCGDKDSSCECATVTADMVALAAELAPGDTSGDMPAVVWELRAAHGDNGVAAALLYITENTDNDDRRVTAELAIQLTVDHFAGMHDDLDDYVRDRYHGRMSDLVDGQNWVLLDEFASEYIKWDRYAEDLEKAGHIESIHASEGVYVWEFSQ